MDVKQMSNCYYYKNFKSKFLLLYKKSIRKSFSLLALTSLLTANASSAEKFLNNSRKISLVDNFTHNKISNSKLNPNKNSIIDINKLR